MSLGHADIDSDATRDDIDVSRHSTLVMLGDCQPSDSAGKNALRPDSKEQLPSQPENDDAELFAAFSEDGDVQAFETLFARHKDAVYRYLWALCGSEAITEDLSQYCWLRLIEQSDKKSYTPRPDASLRSYLYTLGRNRYIDEYQRKHVEKKSTSLDEQAELAARGNACESAVREETRELMGDAVENLPIEQREVLSLWVQGFSIREMMNAVNAPRDTVLSRKKYALKKLRGTLKMIGPRSTHE